MRKALAATVAGYLAAVPKDARAALAKLRKAIRAAAPDATEGISYQVPTYSSIRFPADEPLPTALVTKLVRARIAENERLRRKGS